MVYMYCTIIYVHNLFVNGSFDEYLDTTYYPLCMSTHRYTEDRSGKKSFIYLYLPYNILT